MNFLDKINAQTITMLLDGTRDTLLMTFVSAIIAYIIGMPLGIVLVVTHKSGIRPIPALEKVLGFIVNILRSPPFLIMLILMFPITRAITGTTLGPKAVIPPLVVAAAPYVARIVESSIKEVDAGVIEAAQSMGASPLQIILKVLIPEAKPSLIVGATLATTTILAYSAMAGIVGGGGLGDIAIRYGYYRYETEIMVVTTLVIVVLIQVIQESGMLLSRVTDRRRKV
ncbi:MAG: ABC transporter permease [Lachnospiraceae bacterium]|jgi:D-methionine transport system permease protein|nr:ABC transporter permease [Lachnospiraceae bacterium]